MPRQGISATVLRENMHRLEGSAGESEILQLVQPEAVYDSLHSSANRGILCEVRQRSLIWLDEIQLTVRFWKMRKLLLQDVVRQVKKAHWRGARTGAVHVDADHEPAHKAAPSTEAAVGNARWTVSPAAALRLPKDAFDVYLGLT